MNATVFAIWQTNIARRLRRLQDAPLYPKSEDFNIDQLAGEIEAQIDGGEDISEFIVNQISAQDRRLREALATINHALYDLPSPVLWGLPFTSDSARVKRYELLAVLMVQSGFPAVLLDDAQRFFEWRIQPSSDFFRQRNVQQLNEMKISCFIRRLVCAFYGPITNERVTNRELRDNLARSNAGMTTERLLERELGPVAFRRLGAPPSPSDQTSTSPPDRTVSLPQDRGAAPLGRGPTMLEVLDRIHQLEQQQGCQPMSEAKMAAEIARMRAGEAEYEQRCEEINSQTEAKPVGSGA